MIDVQALSKKTGECSKEHVSKQAVMDTNEREMMPMSNCLCRWQADIYTMLRIKSHEMFVYYKQKFTYAI